MKKNAVYLKDRKEHRRRGVNNRLTDDMLVKNDGKLRKNVKFSTKYAKKYYKSLFLGGGRYQRGGTIYILNKFDHKICTIMKEI